MRRLSLPIVALLLFPPTASTHAGAQLVYTACRRSIVECYPEEQKRPVLRHLDESRQVADELLRLLVERKREEISRLHKGLSVWIQGEPNREVDLATLERALGEITHHEYRGQEAYYDFRDAIDVGRGRAGTWYVVRSTTSRARFATLQITTRGRGEQAKPVVDGVSFSEWAHRPIPAWLSDPGPASQPCICSGMQDGLRVKAS